MPTFPIEIPLSDIYGQHQINILLEQEGLKRDASIDYICGIFDEFGNLLACGGCSGQTLRCIAVSKNAQHQGLMNVIVSHLIHVQVSRGNMHLFVYTKPENRYYFADLGFYEIAQTEKVILMENKKEGFLGYLKNLDKGTCASNAGALIMNANPFTLGHRYLIEKAASDCEEVHLFVLSEENGPIPADVRKRLVLEGISDMKNVVVHDTGSYIISSSTFPSYFLKDEGESTIEQAELDLCVFSRIATELGITRRYVGEEPFSPVTALYNSIMKKQLSDYGIECREIPRLSVSGTVISASAVRKSIHDGHIEAIKDMVPESTWNYFTSADSVAVINAIKAMKLCE